MARAIPQISKIVAFPATWDSGNANAQTGEPIVYKYDPGQKIKIFSVTPRYDAEVRATFSEQNLVYNGKTMVPTTKFSEINHRENSFLARTHRKETDCYWEGFYSETDQELNCNEKNLRAFAWNPEIYDFVIHVGGILDRLAEEKATEEEKNFLTLLGGQPAGGNGSITTVASAAKK